MNPLAPVALLLLGAAGCLLGLLRGFRYTGLLAAATAFAAVLATLMLGLRLPARMILSRWGPTALFPSGLRLAVDGMSWLLALGLLLVVLAVALTGLARPGGRRVLPRAAGLVVVATALTALFADSLVTLAISWTALDAAAFITLVLLSAREREYAPNGAASRAVIGLGFNVLATVFVIAAALESESAGAGALLNAALLPDRAASFLIVAAVLRLNTFPVHFNVASEENLRSGIGTILRMAPIVVGIQLLAFVASRAPQLPFLGWWTAGAAAAVALGAVQWWSAPAPRQGLAYVALAHAGLMVLAALWSGPATGAGVAAQGLALMSGGAVLFLYNGHDPTQKAWAVVPVLAATILAGLPLTVGFVGQWVTLGGLAAGSQWVVLVVVLLAQIPLMAGYLRLAFTPGESLPRGEPLVGVAYIFGLGAPLLFAGLTGLAPASIGANAGGEVPGLFGLFRSNGLVAVIGVTLASLFGVGLWLVESRVREPAAEAWETLVAMRLNWIYALAWDLYRVLRRALRAAAAILEGEGGVLWTLVLALLVWLAFGQSSA